MDSKTIEITDDGFQEQIATAGKPVLVDFWAPWCGPCLMVGPILEELAAAHEGRLVVGKMNVDEHKTTAGRLGVRSIPTMILFEGGREVERIVGAVNKEALEKRLERVLRAAAS